MTEAKALKQLQSGSQDALGWFIDTYTPYVGAIVHNIIGGVMDRADVEETTADVFIALWRSAGRVIPLNIKGYLGSIARNEAKKRLRALGQELPLDEDVLILETDTPEALYEEKELRQTVRQAVLSLPPPDREIFLRYYYYCQKTADISREMALNESTVKSRLRRGREKLRTALLEENRKTGGEENDG